MGNASEQKTFVINTMSEATYALLSAQGKISDKQLNIVDDDDSNRTAVPSYDLLGRKAGAALSYETAESKPWIVLKNWNGEELSRMDASDFLRDGVLNKIEYTGSGLKFTIKTGETETTKTVDFVDDRLVSTSTNAVTNRAVTSGLVEISGLVAGKADASYVAGVSAELRVEIDGKAGLAEVEGLSASVRTVSSDYLKASDKSELQTGIDGRKSVTFRLRDGGFLENITENKVQALTGETARGFVEGVLRAVGGEARVAVIRAGDWKFDVAETIQSDALSGFACVGVNAAQAAGGIGDPYVCKFTVVDDGTTVTAIYGDTRIADAISSTNVSQWANDSGYAVSADVDSKLADYYTKDQTYDRPGIAAISANIVTADAAVTVAKLGSAETGSFATYEVRQNGVKVGDSINIPKDFLVKSGAVSSCVEDDKPIQGLEVGDKYLDFVVNAKAGGEEEDQHIYIDVRDLTDVYVGAETGTVKTFIGSGNQISAVVVNRSITSEKLADGCVDMRTLYPEVCSFISGQYDSAVAYADRLVNGLSVIDLTGGRDKTATKITETGGKISATFENIQIEQSQVTDLGDALDGQKNALKGVVSGLWASLSGCAYSDESRTVPKTSAQVDVDDMAAALVNVINFISSAWSAMRD